MKIGDVAIYKRIKVTISDIVDEQCYEYLYYNNHYICKQWDYCNKFELFKSTTNIPLELDMEIKLKSGGPIEPLSVITIQGKVRYLAKFYPMACFEQYIKPESVFEDEYCKYCGQFIGDLK